MSNRFKIGDRVTWTSQAGGVATRKTGEIVGIVPPEEDPYNEIHSLCGRWNAKSMWGSGFPRSEESYVIFVPSENLSAKGKIYHPIVKNLTLVPNT